MTRVERLGPDGWAAWRSLRLRALAEDPTAFAASTAAWTGPDDVPERWRGRIDSAVACFLAHVAGHPVAMAAVDPGPEDGVVALASMWVAPEVRRQGVGTALVEAVVEVARGRDVVLRVMADNPAAIAAYRSAGFSLVDDSPDDEGCLAMLRRPPSGPIRP